MVEEPGNQVAAGAGILIDEHNFGTEDGFARFGGDGAVGHVPIIRELAL